MYEGKIKTIISDRGFGFISGVDGDVFFHLNDLCNCLFENLYVDQEVKYTPRQTARGLAASNVTPVNPNERGTVRLDKKLFIRIENPTGNSRFETIQFPTGTILGGSNGQQFQIKDALRQGGNGAVFRADRITSDGGIDRLCAVKFLRNLSDTRRDRFNNEVRIMKILDHPFIAPFYDSGTFCSDCETRVEIPWMAMEVGHINLRMHVEREGPLEISKLITVGQQICSALKHVHENELVHRDIKPANFIWTSEDQNEITMIDFGLAKKRHEDVAGRPLDNFTQALEFVGPVFFSSPELIAYANDKTHPVDFRSDLFQLGKVLWYLGTGRISAGIPSKKLDPTGGSLFEIVTNLLCDDPEDRYQDVDEVCAAILDLNISSSL